MNETPVIEDEDGYLLLPYSPLDFMDATVEIAPRDGLDYMIYGMLVHAPPRWNCSINMV